MSDRQVGLSGSTHVLIGGKLMVTMTGVYDLIIGWLVHRVPCGRSDVGGVGSNGGLDQG